MYVWWLSQQDYEGFGNHLKEFQKNWPPYLVKLFDNREGRPGRCRLWTEPNVQFSVEWKETLLSKRLEVGSYGGLVFNKEDLDLVLSLEREGIGIVTDVELNRVLIKP
jgi:hypothetical protein